MVSANSDMMVERAVGFVWTWKSFEELESEASHIDGFSLVEDQDESFFHHPLKQLKLEDDLRQVMSEQPTEKEESFSGNQRENADQKHERILIGSLLIPNRMPKIQKGLETSSSHLNVLSPELITDNRNDRLYADNLSISLKQKNQSVPSDVVQFRLVACHADDQSDWGLYRIDMVYLQGSCIQEQGAVFFQRQLHRIKNSISIVTARVMMGIDDAFDVELGLINIRREAFHDDDAGAVSSFFPPQNTGLKSLDIRLQRHYLQLHTSDIDEENKRLLLTYAADEYANMLQRIIMIGGIEVSSRRVEHIRQSIDRHLPLIERLQAMRRRLEHDCHALKRWWLQLHGKVGELFHILVDSTNDLSMELEQNTRRINKTIEQALRENTLPFYLLGDELPSGKSMSVTRYMAKGGVYHDKIEAYRDYINARLEDDRSVLDKVSSLVDSSDQRATNRALNRVQTWGALLASVAIFTGLMGNFSLDGVGYLTDDILKSDYFSWLGIASFSGLTFYALRLLWRKNLNEKKRGLIQVSLLSSVVVWLFYTNQEGMYAVINDWLEPNSMYEGLPLIYGITYFFVIFSALLLLRQKDLKSWLMLRRELSGGGASSQENRSILRVEGEILDAYEKFFQKKGCEIDEKTQLNQESDNEAIEQLKNNWQYLAQAMDDIDAEKHKRSQASSRFSEQVNSIRDEVLLARSISQCILRLPEHIQDLKNKEIAEHVMLRSNIDFDPMPNKQKISMINEGTLLPAYLAPYSMDAYCLFTHTPPTALKDAVIKTLMESICLYGDSKTLSILADVIVEEEGFLTNNMMALRRRLERHLTGEWIDIFLLLIKKEDFVLSDVSDQEEESGGKSSVEDIKSKIKEYDKNIQKWLKKYEHHAPQSIKQVNKLTSESFVLFTRPFGVEQFLLKQRKYVQSEKIAKARYERLKGNDAPASKLAGASRNIALCLRQQRKYLEEVEYRKLVLQYAKKAIKRKEDFDTLTLLRNYYEFGILRTRYVKVEDSEYSEEDPFYRVIELVQIWDKDYRGSNTLNIFSRLAAQIWKKDKNPMSTVIQAIKLNCNDSNEAVNILIKSKNELAELYEFRELDEFGEFHFGLKKDGWINKAKKLYEQALELGEAWYKDSHINILNSIEGLASIDKYLFDVSLNQEGKDPDSLAGKNSEEMYQRAFDMRKDLFRESHLKIWKALDNLFEIQKLRENYEGAETSARELLVMAKGMVGFNSDQSRQRALNNLFEIQKLQKNYGGAETTAREILKMAKGMVDFNSDQSRQRAWDNLFEIQKLQKNYGGAETTARETLKMDGFPSYQSRQRAWGKLLKVLVEQGKEGQAYQDVKAAYIEEPLQVADLLDILSRACLDLNKFDHARVYAEEALAMTRDEVGTKHYSVRELEHLLSNIKKKRNNVDKS